jgi:hypothetical protein
MASLNSFCLVSIPLYNHNVYPFFIGFLLSSSESVKTQVQVSENTHQTP